MKTLHAKQPGKIVKKQAFGRIIKSKTKTIDGREFTYHATKGWRSSRA